MSELEPIYGGYLLDKQESHRIALGELDTHWQKPSQAMWIHLNARDENDLDWIKNHSGIPSAIAEKLTAEHTRPSMMSYDEGCVLFARGVNLNEGFQPDDMVSVRMYIKDNKLITISLRNVFAIRDTINFVRENKSSVNACVVAILNAITRRMNDTLFNIEERLGDLLQDALDEVDKKNDMNELKVLRRYTINLRRFLKPQSLAMSQLRLYLTTLDKQQAEIMAHIEDTALRYVEFLDAAWEQSKLIQEQYEAVHDKRMNRIIFVLTVLSAIFLPLNFIVGMFGANVGGLPFIDNHEGFLYMWGIMTGSLLITLWLFKKFKWL